MAVTGGKGVILEKLDVGIAGKKGVISQLVALFWRFNGDDKKQPREITLQQQVQLAAHGGKAVRRMRRSLRRPSSAMAVMSWWFGAFREKGFGW